MAFKLYLANTTKQHRIFTYRILTKRADGSIFTAEMSSAVFHAPGGERRTSMVIRDKIESAYIRLFGLCFLPTSRRACTYVTC